MTEWRGLSPATPTPTPTLSPQARYLPDPFIFILFRCLFPIVPLSLRVARRFSIAARTVAEAGLRTRASRGLAPQVCVGHDPKR